MLFLKLDGFKNFRVIYSQTTMYSNDTIIIDSLERFNGKLYLEYITFLFENKDIINNYRTKESNAPTFFIFKKIKYKLISQRKLLENYLSSENITFTLAINKCFILNEEISFGDINYNLPKLSDEVITYLNKLKEEELINYYNIGYFDNIFNKKLYHVFDVNYRINTTAGAIVYFNGIEHKFYTSDRNYFLQSTFEKNYFLIKEIMDELTKLKLKCYLAFNGTIFSLSIMNYE